MDYAEFRIIKELYIPKDDTCEIMFTEGTVISPKESSKYIKIRLGIEINADRTITNFMGDPYFKAFIDADKAEFAKKLARISINNNYYQPHYKRNWTLNSNEKKALIKLLESKDKEGHTIWFKVLEECLNIAKPEELNKFKIDPIEFLQKPMPNYMELKYKDSDKKGLIEL